MAEPSQVTGRPTLLDRIGAQFRVLGSEDRLERPERELRSGFVAVLLPWAVSRCLVAASFLLTAADKGASGGFSAFRIWDVNWYSLIAEHGYHVTGGYAGQTAWPFFPLMPGIMRAGRSLGLDPAVTGTLTGHMAFLLGIWGVYVIARRHGSARSALTAAWVLALFPASAVFSTGYDASVTLACSVWAFILVEDRRDGWAAALAILVVLARPNGIVIVMALAYGTHSLRRALVVSVPAGAALGGWLITLWALSGSPFTFITAKAAWDETTLLLFVRHPSTLLVTFNNVNVDFWLLMISVLVLFLQRRSLPRPWLLLAGLWVLPALGAGIVGSGRYLNQCFPVPVAYGDLLERWPRSLVVLVLGGSAVMLVIVSHNLYYGWAP